MSQSEGRSKNNRDYGACELVKWLSLGLVAWLFLAIISYCATDNAWSIAVVSRRSSGMLLEAGQATALAESGAVHNWCGVCGAWCADLLFSFLGIAAYLVPVVLALLIYGFDFSACFAAPTALPLHFSPLLRALAVPLSLLSASAFFTSFPQLAWQNAFAMGLGGIIGHCVWRGLHFWLGIAGARCLLLWVILTELAILSEVLYQSWLPRIGRQAWRCAWWIARAIIDAIWHQLAALKTRIAAIAKTGAMGARTTDPKKAPSPHPNAFSLLKARYHRLQLGLAIGEWLVNYGERIKRLIARDRRGVDSILTEKASGPAAASDKASVAPDLHNGKQMANNDQLLNQELQLDDELADADLLTGDDWLIDLPDEDAPLLQMGCLTNEVAGGASHHLQRAGHRKTDAVAAANYAAIDGASQAAECVTKCGASATSAQAVISNYPSDQDLQTELSDLARLNLDHEISDDGPCYEMHAGNTVYSTNNAAALDDASSKHIASSVKGTSGEACLVGGDGADVLVLHKTSVGAVPVDVSPAETESLGATVDGQTLDDFASAPTESKLHGAVSTNLALTDSGAVNLDLTTPSNNSSGENKTPTIQQAEARHDGADIAMSPPAWVLPDIELLEHANTKTESACYSQEELRQLSRMVESKLSDFGVKAQVVNVLPGPVITRFELDLSPGTKVSRITGLAKDLARSMSVLSVRVVEVIPGKSVIGLELPNRTREVVRLRELLTSAQFSDTQCRLALALGKSISGEPVVVDLAKMPHLLVAGTTGSGKSVCVNALLLSLLYKYTPAQMRLILIDPKMLELSVYGGIPHLLAPVIVDMKEVAGVFRWCVAEMEHRYRLMAALGVRNLAGYNEVIQSVIARGEVVANPLWDGEGSLEPKELSELPYLVVIADEYADMMMVAGKKIEELIVRLAQKARAAGIHLILATQRPSVDVVTGLIKANIPTRIAFQVSSRIDSRTILDQSGAEQLLGAGDMLYLPIGSGVPVRVHGAFVSDQEVHRVVRQLKSSDRTAEYAPLISSCIGASGSNGVAMSGSESDGMFSAKEEGDELYDQAVDWVIKNQKVSVSSLQRKFRIGYNRAARMVDSMEAAGLVGPMENSGNRRVLVPPPEMD